MLVAPAPAIVASHVPHVAGQMPWMTRIHSGGMPVLLAFLKSSLEGPQSVLFLPACWGHLHRSTKSAQCCLLPSNTLVRGGKDSEKVVFLQVSLTTNITTSSSRHWKLRRKSCCEVSLREINS